MFEWIPESEKYPDRIDALVYTLLTLNLNGYAGSYFDLPVLIFLITREPVILWLRLVWKIYGRTMTIGSF